MKIWNRYSFSQIAKGLYLCIMAAAILFIMFLVVAQVIARYVFNTGIFITEEMVSFMMVWIAMIGSAYAFYSRRHMTIDLLKERLSPRAQDYVQIFVDIFILVTLVLVHIMGGISFATLTKGQTTATLGFSAFWLNVSLAVGGVLGIIFCVLSLIQRVFKIMKGGQS